MVRSIFVTIYYVTTGSWNSCGRSRGRGGIGGGGAAAKKKRSIFFASGPAAAKPRQ